MSSDELLQLITRWAAMNHPDLTLEDVRLGFSENKKIVWLVPKAIEADFTGQLHSVERAILKTLRAAGSQRVSASTLLVEVRKFISKCSESTFYRYLGRLKVNGRILERGDGYVIAGNE